MARLPTALDFGAPVTPSVRPAVIRQSGAEANGRALQQAGAVLSGLSDDLYKKDALSQAQEAAASYTNFTSKLLFDPENGAMNKTGSEALDLSDYQRRMEEERSRIRSRLTNRQAIEAFDANAQVLMSRTNENLLKHAATQRDAYQKQAHVSFVESNINLAANDPSNADVYVMAAQDATEAQLLSQGVDPTTIQNAKRKVFDSIQSARIQSLALQGRVSEAKNILSAVGSNMSAEVRMKLDEYIRPVFIDNEAEKVAQSAYIERTMSRGERNNNPLNIIKTKDKWTGEVDGQDEKFKTFATKEDGEKAAKNLLLSYQKNFGLKTISGIIGKWAPSNENDTSSYINTVSRLSGIPPEQEIDLNDAETMNRVYSAMYRVENGYSPSYSPPSYDEILTMSGGDADVASRAQSKINNIFEQQNKVRKQQKDAAINDYYLLQLKMRNGVAVTEDEKNTILANFYSLAPEEAYKDQDKITTNTDVYYDVRGKVLRGEDVNFSDYRNDLSASDIMKLMDERLNNVSKEGASVRTVVDRVVDSMEGYLFSGETPVIRKEKIARFGDALYNEVRTSIDGTPSFDDVRKRAQSLMLKGTTTDNRGWFGRETMAFESKGEKFIPSGIKPVDGNVAIRASSGNDVLKQRMNDRLRPMGLSMTTVSPDFTVYMSQEELIGLILDDLYAKGLSITNEAVAEAYNKMIIEE